MVCTNCTCHDCKTAQRDIERARLLNPEVAARLATVLDALNDLEDHLPLATSVESGQPALNDGNTLFVDSTNHISVVWDEEIGRWVSPELERYDREQWGSPWNDPMRKPEDKTPERSELSTMSEDIIRQDWTHKIREFMVQWCDYIPGPDGEFRHEVDKSGFNETKAEREAFARGADHVLNLLNPKSDCGQCVGFGSGERGTDSAVV